MLSPVKLLSFTTPHFLKGGYFCAQAAPAQCADKRSTASPPMHSGGSGPWGDRRQRTRHPPELLAWDTRPRGSHREALPHQRATPLPGSGSPPVPTPPGFGVCLHGSSGPHQPFKLQLLRLHQTSPNTAPTIPDLISSSTCQIRFNASPSCLLTLPSRQDLPPLLGAPVHWEQNSSPGGSCKLCRTSEILQYSSQRQNSMF